MMDIFSYYSLYMLHLGLIHPSRLKKMRRKYGKDELRLWMQFSTRLATYTLHMNESLRTFLGSIVLMPANWCQACSYDALLFVTQHIYAGIKRYE